MEQGELVCFALCRMDGGLVPVTQSIAEAASLERLPVGRADHLVVFDRQNSQPRILASGAGDRRRGPETDNSCAPDLAQA
jgi:hypothetical protein